MNGITSCSNILLSTAEGYAEFLAKRFNEFVKIAGSGYQMSWFPQNLYLYWRSCNNIKNLELWGNMGPHYDSNKVFQFSEVLVDKSDSIFHGSEYLSDIFLFLLIGKEKSIVKDLSEMKDHIYKKKVLLPYKIFLVRLDMVRAEGKDPNAFDPDTLFKDFIWHYSFQFQLEKYPILFSVSIGELTSKSFLDNPHIS
jgi:hypothetical protein